MLNRTRKIKEEDVITGSRQNAIPRTAPARQRGVALVTVIIFVAIAAAIGIGTMSSSRTNQMVAHNDTTGKQALFVAEAGINDSFARIKSNYSGAAFLTAMFDTELANGGTAGVLTGVGSLVDLDNAGVNYRFANFGGAGAGDGYFVKVVDNFDEVPNDATTDADRWIELVSVGRIGTARREIRARVQGISTGWGLYGKDKVTITGDSITDSFDPNSGPYDPLTAEENGNVGSNGDIEITGGASYIHGDATASGSVTAPGQVSGNATDGAPPQTLPSVLPCSPYSDGTGVVSGSYNPATGELLGDGGNPVVELNPGTHCFSSLTLTGTAILTVSGPTEIYLTGDSDLTGGGVVNTTGNADDLQILSSGDSLVIAGSVNAFMEVYAPDTIVDILGGSQLTGSIVGQEVTLSGTTEFHYDESLADSSNFVLTAWREVL